MFSLSSSVSLNLLYWFFYLLFNAILSRQKLKLLAWILLFIFTSCNAHFKCKYKSTWLKSGITELIQFIFYSLYVHCILLLPSGTQKLLYKTNTVVFLFHFSTCAHYTNILPSLYWWVRKDWKRKELLVPYISLFFSVFIFSTCVWLINTKSKYQK